MTAPADRRVIQCNIAPGAGSSIAAAGARAYIVLANPGGGHDRVEILVRSRGGRWVQKWEDVGRLVDFRVKVLPPAHPLYDAATQTFTDERIGDLVAALRAASTRAAAR